MVVFPAYLFETAKQGILPVPFKEDDFGTNFPYFVTSCTSGSAPYRRELILFFFCAGVTYEERPAADQVPGV